MKSFNLLVAALTAGALTSFIAMTSAHAETEGPNAPGSPAYSHTHRGVMPVKQQAAPGGNKRSSKMLSYGGGVDGIGVTSGTPKVYLIFWGTQWGTQSTDGGGNLTFSDDPKNGAPTMQQMFKGLGTGGELWSGAMTQYLRRATGFTRRDDLSCRSGARRVPNRRRARRGLVRQCCRRARNRN